MRVLYVEDDPRDVDLTLRELNRSAPQIILHLAPTLADARRHLADLNDAYDLALVDLHLPDGTGLELLEEIRTQALPLAVVILTGLGDEATAVAALKAGADDYVTKSKNYLTHLALILEDALGRYNAHKARRAHPIRVLYAERNATDVDFTQRHLAHYALHIHLDVVYSASDVMKNLFESEHGNNVYDVLLLDYHLPGVSGLELLKTLYQERQLALPTVLVTGHGDEDVAVQALRLGASDYVVKNPGYLFKLPAILENAYFDAELQRERQQLAASEERFRLLAENARDVIYRYRISPTPSFEYISPSVTAFTGYTPEEYYANPQLSLEIVHPDDRSLLAEGAVPEYIDHALTLRWVCKDGTVIWTEQRNTPIYDAHGDLIALEGIARDITLRQQTLEALQASEIAEREQRQLAEALRDTAAALISAQSLDTVMNIILENVSRVVPNDAVNIMLVKDNQGQPFYWRGYRAERAPYLQELSISIEEAPHLHHMFVTGTASLISHTEQYAGWISQPDTKWIKSYVAAPIRSHGQVIGFLNLDNAEPGFYTERHVQHLQAFADQASLAIEHAQLYDEIQRHAKELEQRVADRTAEFQRSQARYRAIVEDQTDMVCRYLPGGVLTFVNPTYCRHFDRTPEELLGISRFTLVPEDERSLLEQQIESLSLQNPVTTVEIREPTPDGRERWMQWNERMLFDEAGHFVEYQGVGRDITDRRLAENQLRLMLEEAMKLSELRSRYVSMAAHDLRNPLAAIQSAISLVQDYGDKLTEERKQEKFDRIQSSIKNMVDMLNDILTIGQTDSGKLQYSPIQLNLTAFCEGLIDEMKPVNGATRQIEFSSHNDCTRAYLDPKLLRHILSNLLSNALKYSDEDTAVEFTLQCDPDQIVFRIQDHGIGIPEADQVRLFEAFHRASNARAISGTGLGLAIVRQSVDLHGGTITFESQENVGTTFVVSLPRVSGK